MMVDRSSVLIAKSRHSCLTGQSLQIPLAITLLRAIGLVIRFLLFFLFSLSERLKISLFSSSGITLGLNLYFLLSSFAVTRLRSGRLTSEHNALSIQTIFIL